MCTVLNLECRKLLDLRVLLNIGPELLLISRHQPQVCLMTAPLRVEWNSLGLTHWKHSPSDPDELLDLGLLLLVGPLLLVLEWLLEPDLE